ncbi:MAG: FAD-binding protein [Paracoccaceae bacterium]|nr:FAD-binding protein [Paracoccaceae bacterium]
MTIETAIAKLQDLLGDKIVTSDAVRDQHGANETWFDKAPPDAVAFPESTDDVAAIVRVCNEEQCPIVAFGQGSSLEGQHLAVEGGISLDLNKMNHILQVNAEDMNVVVQPGVTRRQLQADLRATGMFFPIDPGADASFGGMAATRASGTTAVRYGTMRENILALEAVMADGTVIRTGSKARKSSSGYDLTHLLIGSEGTLGIITEITLKLYGVPEATSAATCRFPSVEDAVNAVILTIQSGIPMARIELVDEMMVRGFNLYSKTDLPEEPHLFVEFHGSPSGVKDQATHFGEIAEEFGGSDFNWADREEDRAKLWRMRHDAHFASGTLAPGKKPLTTDICVPISKLADAVTSAQKEAKRLGLTAIIVGHVGDGNFHCGVLWEPSDAEERARVEEFSNILAENALALGGTVTGEHGIGLGKMKFMNKEHGPAIAYMRAVKAAFDPNNILNPGKMLPPGNH